MSCFQASSYYSYCIPNLLETASPEQFIEKTTECFTKTLGEKHFAEWAGWMQRYEGVDVAHMMNGNLSSPLDWGNRIKISPLSEAIIWTSAFFDYVGSKLVEKKLPSQNALEILSENVKIKDLFLDRLPGMKIVGGQDDDIKCHTLVFGEESWYGDIDIGETFFSGAENCFKFLRTKYDLVENPSLGAVAVYGTVEEVKHFGVVVGRERSTGEVVVESKFGGSFCFLHRAIIPLYGDQVRYIEPI